ncbi:MAG: hypothetical protein R6U10_00430 [Thermoplasmatota archaeon]
MSLAVSVLQEIIEGKPPVEQRIAVFERVRDIPYRLIPALYDPAIAPAGILQANAGSCTPKHFLLGGWLERLGYPVRYVTSVFDWNSPALAFSEELRRLAGRYPDEYHLCLEVSIEDSWRLVDATWDPGLHHLGFNVNETWDGVSDTDNAVEPLDTIVHASPGERDRYAAGHRHARSAEENAVVERFTMMFNRWLDAARCRQR